MKRLMLFSVAALLVLASCSRKTHPATTKSRSTRPAEPVTQPVQKNKEPETAAVTDAPVTTPAESAAPVFNTPLIVIDESGKVVTPVEKLPVDLATKVDYKKISKGFSAEQRKNLIYRFKMVPPKVLFVPADLASKGSRGTYVIYKKKFYYWKKDDGLFHLDETYYQ